MKPGRPQVAWDEEDDYLSCEHGLPLEAYCEACEGGALFDADELGLDPEEDDDRA